MHSFRFQFSYRFRFSELECIWSQEPVHIDEDIRTVRNGNIVIFFELIDNVPTSVSRKRHKNGECSTVSTKWNQIKIENFR